MPTFRPKRQWKPKRKDRNIPRRRLRRRWWRRNKAAVKMRRRRRYRQMKHNSMFKAWRKKRQKEKHKRRMRFAAEGMTTLPETWFVFHDTPFSGDLRDVDMGFIEDYDPDTEDLLIYDVDDGTERVVDLEDFLANSDFLEEADIDNFELLMDQYYGGPEDDLDLVPETEQLTSPPMVMYDDPGALQKTKELVKQIFQGEPWFVGVSIGPSDDGEHHAVALRVLPGFRNAAKERLQGLDLPVFVRVIEMTQPTPRPGLVASEWLRKVAFNKENPTDLLMQLGKVLDKAQRDADGVARTRLRNVSMRIRGLGRDVQEAWRRRRED